MTSQEANGSYMRFFDVMKYFEDNDISIESPIDEFIVVIDGIKFFNTRFLKCHIPSQDFREMQCKVTTSVFALEPIVTWNPIGEYPEGEEVWLDQDYL